MMIGNRKEEERVCIVLLNFIRKNLTPSENRLTAILKWKKAKSVPGLSRQNSIALPLVPPTLLVWFFPDQLASRHRPEDLRWLAQVVDGQLRSGNCGKDSIKSICINYSLRGIAFLVCAIQWHCIVYSIQGKIKQFLLLTQMGIFPKLTTLKHPLTRNQLAQNH